MHPALLQPHSHSAISLALAAAFIAACVGCAGWFALRARLVTARSLAAGFCASVLVLGGALLAQRGSARVAVHVEPFGLFLALGLVAGVALSAQLASDAGLPRGRSLDALLGAAIGSLLGARALYVLGTPVEGGAWGWLAFQRGGLSGYGAALGAWLGALVPLLRARTSSAAPGPPPSAWLEVGAPGFLLCAAIARLGCYLAGCDFGRPFHGQAPAWLERLTRFPQPAPGDASAAYSAHALVGDLSHDGRFTPALHPTQLYETLGALSLLALLLALRGRQRRHGTLFGAATLGYALLRLLTEPLRGDVERGMLGRFSVTQLCALLSAFAVALFWAHIKLGATAQAE